MGKSMGASPTACEEARSAGQLVSCYALVTYVPGRLGEFLTSLRCELVPGCHLRSHVTFLPPRKLDADQHTAWQRIASVCERWTPFTLELTQIEFFPGTNVAYVALGEGRVLVEQLHQQLNCGPLYFDEPFAFHPHITLAQGVEAADVAELKKLAEARWREYRGERSFSIDEITFVQNVAENEWVDLNALTLSMPSVGQAR